MSFTVTFNLTQIHMLEMDLQGLREMMPLVYTATVREVGLFIEREAKEVLTRKGGVDTGRLRASIGHGDGGIWNEEFKPGVWTVEVGTNVEYAPYMEFGFTMSTPHVAFIKGVGFRYIHPFSFLGYHYMEEASVSAQRMAPKVLDRYVDQAIKKLNLG